MKYKDYKKLGFKRTNCYDNVEKDITGYGGFSLTKVINEKMSICADSSSLDKPNLYIAKGNDLYHILPINGEIVKSLCND